MHSTNSNHNCYNINVIKHQQMLTYYPDQSNIFTIRTTQFSGSPVSMSLQDMYTLTNTTGSITGISYDPYESILSFTGSINPVSDGDQFRVELSSNQQVIWNGTIQVVGDPAPSKAVYQTQNTQYTSSLSSNEYIIM